MTEIGMSNVVSIKRQQLSGFDHFWSEYPRRVGKGAARKAYERALKLTDHETIIDGLNRWKASDDFPADRQFMPHPSTWLNQERWDDEYEGERRQEMRDATPEEAARYYREQGRDRLADLCLSDQRPEWLSLKVPVS